VKWRFPDALDLPAAEPLVPVFLHLRGTRRQQLEFQLELPALRTSTFIASSGGMKNSCTPGVASNFCIGPYAPSLTHLLAA
jgi:hypothetical protein